MSQQELTWKVTIDPALAAAAMRSLADDAKTTSASIQDSVRKQAAEAIRVQNEEFREVQKIHAAKLALAQQETNEIIAIHAFKVKQAESEGAAEMRAIQAIHAEKVRMAQADAALVAKMEAEIAGFGTKNLVNDLTKFQSVLQSNSATARTAADDFLRLLSPVKSIGTEVKTAEHESAKLGEVFRALASSAVIAEGPLGGVAGRLRGLSAESTELSHLIGPGGLLIAGLLGLGFAAFALGDVIFSLAEKAAEAGKQILDISQKTNLSTQAVSAFKVASELAGTTLAETGNKLAGFNVAMGQAQNGNKEMAKAFRDMGISLNQTSEGALAQFLKRFEEMGPSAARNSAEAKIFRDRTGELIPVLIELGGSLDEAKQKAKDLGLSFDEVSTKQAKEFEEKIKLLKLGVEGLSEQIGMRSIPAIEAAMSELSRSLGLQENSWRAWGEYIGNVLSGVVINTGAAVAAINRAIANISVNSQVGSKIIGDVMLQGPNMAMGPISGLLGARNIYRDITTASSIYNAQQTPAQAYEAERNRLMNIAGTYKPPGPAGVTDRGNTGSGGGGKGRTPRDTSANDEFEAEKKAIEEREAAYREETERLKHEYDLRHIAFEEYIQGERDANAARLKSILDEIDKEQEALDTAHARGLIKDNDYAKKDAELTAQTKKAQRENKKEEDRIDDEDYKSRLKALQDFNNQKLELDKKDAEIRIAEIKDSEVQSTKTHLDAAREQIDIEQGLLTKRRDNLRAEIAVTREKSEEWKHLNQQILLLAKEQEAFDAESKRKTRDAAKQDADDTEKELQRKLQALRDFQSAFGKLLIDGLKIDEETARLRLDILRTSHAPFLQILQAELDEQTSQENKRHAQNLREIEDDRDKAVEKAKTWRELLAALKAYDLAVEAENKRHVTAGKSTDAQGKAGLQSLIAGGPFAEGLKLINQHFGEGTAKAQLFAAALGAIDSAAQGVGQAVGDMTQSLVLYGTTGTSFQKVAAQIIASLASQAAAQAAYQLASGLAWEALFWFTGEPRYQAAASFAFLAAAAFGAVAAVTAVAGRAVAGNAFASASGSGGGSAGSASRSSGSSSGSQQSNEASPITLGSQRGPDVIHLKVQHSFKNDGTIHSYVESAVMKSATGNGPIRKVIVEEVKRQN